MGRHRPGWKVDFSLDGAQLSHDHLLLAKGYRVVGSSRDAQMSNTSRLERIGIAGEVQIMSLAPNDFRSVLKVVSGVEPDEIYNLAGQTSVGLSFEQSVECMESIAGGTLNLLEVVRYLGKLIPYPFMVEQAVSCAAPLDIELMVACNAGTDCLRWTLLLPMLSLSRSGQQPIPSSAP